jgi:hypothetical protein
MTSPPPEVVVVQVKDVVQISEPLRSLMTPPFVASLSDQRIACPPFVRRAWFSATVIELVAFSESAEPAPVTVRPAFEVTLVPVTAKGPALEIAALNVTSPSVVAKVRVAPGEVLDTALLTVIAPVLRRVAVVEIVS